MPGKTSYVINSKHSQQLPVWPGSCFHDSSPERVGRLPLGLHLDDRSRWNVTDCAI